MMSVVVGVDGTAASRAAIRIAAQEARYRRDINHQISKELVATAKGTQRGIAMEDLAGSVRLRLEADQVKALNEASAYEAVAA